MQLRPKHLLILWLAGFLLSLAIQSVFQGWFAEVTTWGRNAGWQTEIAVWNAGVALVLAALLRRSEEAQAAVVPGLALLSLAFGVNHLHAGIANPAKIGHWMGAGANFLGVLVALLYYTVARRSPRNDPAGPGGTRP